MQALKRQNDQLQRTNQNFQQQIERQKELNAQHQTQIETLLKFNQRLLGIIENQLNNKKDNCSLQPISERSERESDLIAPTVRSFVRTRNNAAKSERGGTSTSNSLVEKGHMSGNKLNLYGREVRPSDLNKSTSHEDSFCHTEYIQNGVPAVIPVNGKYSNQLTVPGARDVKQELSRQISQFKKFKNQSTKFYDAKIGQIRSLSSKINKYHPMEQINKITNKLTLSNNTSRLIQNVLAKKSQ